MICNCTGSLQQSARNIAQAVFSKREIFSHLAALVKEESQIDENRLSFGRESRRNIRNGKTALGSKNDLLPNNQPTQ
jgi:hypothetical protein